MLDCVPSVIGGKLPQGIRNKRHLIGFYFQHKVYKFLFGAITFNIEFGCNELADVPYILVADMPFIGSWMYGHAIRAEELDITRYFQQIGIVSSPRIAQRGNFIDVDGEFGHSVAKGNNFRKVLGTFEYRTDGRIFLRRSQVIPVAVNGIFPATIVGVGQYDIAFAKIICQLLYRRVAFGNRFFIE